MKSPPVAADLLPRGDIRIVTVDAELVVAIKPAGLSTQAPPGADSLEQRLRHRLDDPRITPVHRLDRPTSGLVLCGRTKTATRRLGDQFAARRVTKVYWADVDRVDLPIDWSSRWQDWMEKLPDRAAGRIVAGGTESAPSPTAKRAITEVSVESQGRRHTRLTLRPATGRMHQLRLQCAHRGWPIIGDDLYGPTTPAAFDGDSVNLDSPPQSEWGTLHLYAVELCFRHPKTLKLLRTTAAEVADPLA